ncbi:MAG: Ig-like domain-containing protein [Pseudomonadota bacterium]
MALEQTNSVAPFQNTDLASPFAPPPPSVGSAADDAGDILGSIAPGGVTDDRQPEFSGRGTPGDTIVIRDNDNEIGTTEVAEDGTWSFTPSTDLSEGLHAITVVARNPAGEESAPSAAFNFEIDVTPPDASQLAITGVMDAVGGVTGNVAPGATTDDTRPLLSGTSTGVPGHTVTVMVRDASGTRELGQATIGENGQWTFQVDAPLAAGTNTFTLVERDVAGNETMPTGRYTVTVITDKPTAPVIDSVFDDVGEPHMLQQGEATNDARPTLAGTAQANHTVKLYDGSTLLGQVVADASGKWSFTPPTDLADGAHGITATSSNPLGQTSEASASWNFVVDTVPPNPATAQVLDDVGALQGALKNGDTTDDDQPEFKGTAEPGATVNVYDGTQLLGSALVDANGDWRFTPTEALKDGDHAFILEVVDPAGNSTGRSPPLNINVDTRKVDVSISKLVDDQGPVTGAIDANGVTDDARPEIQGEGKAGSTIKVYDGATLLGETVVKADGTWSFTPTADLSQGAHAITATATDKAGGPSAPTQAFHFTVDTVPPAKPTIVSVVDDVGPVIGNVSKDGFTNDTRPALSGKAEANSTVVIYDNGVELTKVTANASGDWTYTPATALGQGAHSITVTAVDKAGNTSVASDTFGFTVDTVAPAKPTIVSVFDDVGPVTGNVSKDGFTNDARPALSGKAEANSTVVIHDNGVELAKVTANASGDWTFTPVTALGQGAHSITVTAMDKAGNTSVASDAFGFTVDTVAPAQPTIVSAYDDVGSIQGNVTLNGVTDDPRPDFKGKAEANSTVVIYDNGVELTRVTANASGDWTWTPATALSNGMHTITVTAVDKAGNASAPSDAFGFTVDTVAPTQTATVSDIGKDSGFSVADYLTNDGSAGRLMQGNLSAVLTKGDVLQVSTDGGATWKEAFVSGSKWSAQDDSSHAGNWTVQTRVVDAAGNVGAVKSQTISLDTTAPKAPTKLVAVSGGMEVHFDATNVAVGHKISLLVRGDYFDYTLTAADIAAGKYFFADPLPSTVLTFEGLPKDLPTNSMTFGDLTVTSAEKMTVSDYANGRFGTTGSSLWLASTGKETAATHYSSKYQFANGRSAVSFTIGGHNGTGEVKFYDVAGNLLKTIPVIETIPVASYQRVEFTAPAGTKIGYFVVSSVKDVGGFVLDNLQLSSALLEQSLSAAIVDPAGNVSQYRDASTVSDPLQSQVLTDASKGTLYGGSGNNEFVVSNVAHLADSAISGNGGTDTLKLTGANQTLDLTALAGKISSVEIIDITGTGNNTLKLSLADVMNNGTKNQFVSDGRVQMMVKGNAGDKVTLSDALPNGTDPGDWVKKANVTVGGVVYEVYQYSGFGAELLVQQGVTVTLQNAGAATFHISPEPEAFVLDHATQAWTESDDTIIAKLGFADRLEGGAGNDTFLKVGTGDTVHGGSGDDVIRVNSGDFAHIDGGLGIDTLVMDGKAMHIDLSALGLKVQGVEKFDLGAGGNTLALSTHDVLAGGARDMVVADGKVQMLVNGTNGDVNLLGGTHGDDGWTQGDNATVGGVTYSVYTNLAGTAELLVEDKVHVTIL